MNGANAAMWPKRHSQVSPLGAHPLTHPKPPKFGMTQYVHVTIPYAKVIETANYKPNATGVWFLEGHEIVMKGKRPFVILHWKGHY